MKKIHSLFAVAALAIGSASAQEAKPAAAACPPPPKELVTKDLEKGEGEAVMVRTAVAVGYTGWLYDGCAKDLKGEKFDSSDGRPTPFGFMVGAGRVIKGWDEGLVGMQQGGKRLLVIPADKAYGARSPSPKIAPNSALVFEVTLQSILSSPGAPPGLSVTQPKQ